MTRQIGKRGVTDSKALANNRNGDKGTLLYVKKWRAGKRGRNSPLIRNICYVREQILPSFAIALLKVCLHMSTIRGKNFP